MKRFCRWFCVSVVVFCTLNVQANSLSLLPAMTSVNDGDVVAIEVWGEFGSEPAIGGGFDIVFDPSALQFEAVVLEDVGDPQFLRAPDEFPGLLESWTMGDFVGLPQTSFFIGTLFFTVLPEMGASTTVMTGATSGTGGPFTDAFFPVHVDFGDTTLTRMPLPAAAWLMLGGLASLGALRRRA